MKHFASEIHSTFAVQSEEEVIRGVFLSAGKLFGETFRVYRLLGEPSGEVHC